MNEPSKFDAPTQTDHAAQELKAAVVGGAHDVGDGMRDLAKDLTGSTKKGAESQINAGKTKIVEGLGSVAGALRKTGENLGDDDGEMLAGYLDSAAEKVEGVSTYLKDRSLSNLAGDLKQFARREPALFLGGGLVLGLIAGRFLKSASPEAPRQMPMSSAPTTQRQWQPASPPSQRFGSISRNGASGGSPGNGQA